MFIHVLLAPGAGSGFVMVCSLSLHVDVLHESKSAANRSVPLVALGQRIRWNCRVHLSNHHPLGSEAFNLGWSTRSAFHRDKTVDRIRSQIRRPFDPYLQAIRVGRPEKVRSVIEDMTLEAWRGSQRFLGAEIVHQLDQ